MLVVCLRYSKESVHNIKDGNFTMAANTNKRIPLKHIRDRAKSRYPDKQQCAICNTQEELELHHYTGLSNLLDKWSKEKGISLDTDEEVLEVRDQFISEHEYELFEAVVVLCAPHHLLLHKIYGKSPPLHTASKQAGWVQKQKEKHENKLEPSKLGDVSEKQSSSAEHCNSGGVFGRLILQYDYFAGFRKT